jgi:aspartyl-tRNA synthetase
MELQDLGPALEGTTFAPFASVLEKRGEVKGLNVRGGAHLSRKALDELQEFVRRYGAGALAWVKLGDELSSSLLKALGEETVKRLAEAAGASKDDAVLVVAGNPKTVAASLGALRNELARREKLIPANTYAPLWVTDFPMFEYDEEHGRFYAMHHPFTSPLDEDLPLFERAVEGGETELLGGLRATASRSRAAPSASTAATCSGSSSRRSGSPRRRRARASASSSTRSNSARRRTAASPPASSAC